MQFQVITEHEASLDALCHLYKTDNHNPQWRLNQNWEILQSINHNNDIHNMKCQLAQDDNPTHTLAIDTANTRILEYQAANATSVARQQPTLDYGRAYLRQGNTIINEKYDEIIIHAYNWPKFTQHCRNKFLWTDSTFNSIHWKAFQHQGNKLGITRHTHLLKFVYEWLPIGETLVRINSTVLPRCPSCDTPTETHAHIFRCPNPQRRQITDDCLAQIDLINIRWNVPDPVRMGIQTHLSAWTTENLEPPAVLIATNPDHTTALQAQT
jgi:hypothetical protein